MGKLTELSNEDCIHINGGKISTETSIFYDIGWWIGTGIRKVEEYFD